MFWEAKINRELPCCCWAVRDVIVTNLCAVKFNGHSVTSSPVAVWENTEGRAGSAVRELWLWSEILCCHCRLAKDFCFLGGDVGSLCKYVWKQTFRKIVTRSGSVKWVTVGPAWPWTWRQYGRESLAERQNVTFHKTNLSHPNVSYGRAVPFSRGTIQPRCHSATVPTKHQM